FAGFGGVEPAEGVGGPAEAGAAAAGAELAAGIDEDIGDALFVGAFFNAAEVEAQHVRVHFGGAGDDEGFDLDFVPFQDVSGEDHVGDFAAGAGADVGAIQGDIAAIAGGVAIVRGVRFGDQGLEGAQVPLGLEGVFRILVILENFPVGA